jgi:hypothetical protein
MAPNNEHRYNNTNEYAGDQAADTRRVMNHMPDEDRVPTPQIQQSINSRQAADLSSGDVRMGDDRVIGDTPNWASYDSKQLYNFATQNNSPYTADDLGRAFNDGGNSLAEAANGLLDAVGRLDGSWSGVAADSAKTALQPLAQAAGTAGTTAQLMGVKMSQQSVAASEVRKLPPAKDFDQQQSLNAMVAGGPAAMQADLKVQKDAADAVKREQISYLTAYTTSMAAVDAQTPSFVPPEERIGSGGSSSSSFSGSSVSIPGTGSVGPNVRGGTTTGGPSSKFTGVGGPNGSPGFTGNDPGQTDQSGFTPLPGVSTGASGYTPPTTTAAPSTFGPSGGAPVTSGPGAGAGGFGAGFGSFGGNAAGGAGAGAGAGSGTGGNPNATGPRGMTPGMGPGGSAGRGGPGGMGGAGRGKGDGEEDKEHERPAYLVEGDPESTFGNDQLTAPPVIGGDD